MPKRRISIAVVPNTIVDPVRLATIRAPDPHSEVIRTLRGPTAERAQWDDPEVGNIRAKTTRQVYGYRAVDPLVTLHRRGELVTSAHLRAANQFRDDYEIGIEGARPSQDRSQEIRGSAGADGPSFTQLAALQRYRQARNAVGVRLSDILVGVVLAGATVTEWSEKRALSSHQAMGYLIAALDCLQDHYEIA